MSSPAPRVLSRPLAILLSFLLAFAGIAVIAPPATAATGDVAGATLDWGIRQSFRNYISGPIAHGSWTVSGVSDTTPYHWSGGSGSTNGTPAVSYPGSIHFVGHQGFGVEPEEYALDLTFSDVRVRITGASTAELVLDARSRGLSDPTTFAELDDVVFATLDLAAGTNGSSAETVAYSGVPATLTSEGAVAFGGFYTAGAALDPVSFSWPVEQAPAPVVPTVTVSQTTGLESGDTVTVTGTGFGPNAEGGPLGTRQPLSGKFGGVYVTFGTFLDTWKPSAGAPSSARKAAPGVTKWFVNAEDVATVGAAGGGVAINPDGSFTLDIVVTEDFAGALADGNYGIYTYAGSGAVYAPFETYTRLAFAEDVPPVDPGTPLTAGSLSWGIKASFRDYITGPIAQGSITVGSNAGTVGGVYWFPQSSELSGSGSNASASYRGSVTFTGHSGALNLRLSDPIVRLTGPTSAVLSLQTPTGRVDFATLAIASSFPATDATGARTYTSVPATLTAAGAASFEGFYSAGTALDPVTFTLGSPNGTSGRGTTVSAVSASTTRTPAATPPATTGVSSETPSTGFTSGGTYTFTAGGFQPNETGILVVIYSTPTVLATDATADANGVVTWTGPLPAGLSGAHTFTFQGSVDRGLELEIAAAEAIGCPVESAELSWGFKESFRAYIDGSIANGEWTVADGATYETPLFGWTGTGGYDAETGDADLAFAGSVRFTGHGGVLDTTIANPRVVIDGDRAVLLLDVTGTTQEGTAVAQVGVEFAELDLAAAEQTGEGDVVAFTGIPAVLTEAGAAAFGTYEAGSELDPVDLSITVDPACVEPAAAVDEPATTSVEAVNTSDTSAIVWIVLAILVALAVAVVAILLVRRARKA